MNVRNLNIYIQYYNTWIFIKYLRCFLSNHRDSGRRSKFPWKYQQKKRRGRRRWRGSIYPTNRLPKVAFFKVDLKCFPIEPEWLSRMIYRFSWAIRIRCRKPHFKNFGFSATLKYVKFVLLLCKNFSSFWF